MINRILVFVIYIPIAFFSTLFFLLISFLLIPISYFIAIINKTIILLKCKLRLNYKSRMVDFGLLLLFIMFGIPALLFLTFLDTYMFAINLFTFSARLRNQALLKKDMTQMTLQTLDAFLRNEIKQRKIYSDTRALIKSIQKCFKIPRQISLIIHGGVNFNTPDQERIESQAFEMEFGHILESVPGLKEFID